MPKKNNSALLPFAKDLRRNMTKEERRLWYDFLRQYPVHFKKQKIIGPYIVDFYCAKAGLVIELDGSQHFEPERMERDAERTHYLQQYGLTVLRIPNNEVINNLVGVCEWIDRQVRQRIAE